MASIALSVRCSQLFCFVLLFSMYVCGYGVGFGPYGQFGGHFSCSLFISFTVYMCILCLPWEM